MSSQAGFLVLFAGTVIAAFSQILLKKSAIKTYDNIWREYINPYVIIGYGMMFISMFCTILAYKGIDYKNGPIVESLGYIIVLGLSFLVFGERMTKKKWLGTALIIAGVIVFHQ